MTSNSLTALIGMLVWVSGIVLAKGFWSTFASIIFAPYAWYLVAERALIAIGWA